jgi:Pretoxin HINT domain
MAADPETGEDGARPVTKLITGHGDKTLVKITTDADADGAGDGVLQATDGHPFWVVSEKRWLAAEHLEPGMTLLAPDGAEVTVIAVVAWGAVVTVHNLTVDDIHTYYVVAGSVPVLVHNTGAEACTIDPAALAQRAEEAKRAKRQADAVEEVRTSNSLDEAADKALTVEGCLLLTVECSLLLFGVF